mgnify:FL=1|jgi:hypothetical protein
MSIKAGYLVAITPRTISAGASDLETNGMLLTKSALLPSGTPAMAFASAAAVAAFFGDASDEAVFAQQYFTGLTNQQKAPTSLVIGRRIDDDAPAWIRSGAISADLAAFKKVTDGAMKITIDGSEKTATAVDLSSANSLSEVVQTIATALTGCTGSYDSTTNTFTLTSSTDGASSTVSYASTGDDGTDLSAMLCMTQAEGAVLSQGVDAMTESATLDAIRAVTANWAQFTTLWEVTEQDEAEAYAAWADIDDDYVYVFWSSDRNMESTLTQDSTIAKALQDKYNCVFMIYSLDFSTAAFALAYPATIKWDATQGMKVIFGKSASGLSPMVTDEQVATALDDLGVSYVGQFATRNDEFIIANRGELTGSMYGFYDTLIGSIWLRSKLQTSIMNGFATVNRAPYNNVGYTMLKSWCQDPITQAKNAGVIDEGLSLSESQKSQILQETGDSEAVGELQSKGYFLQILDPGASVRAQRGSPVAALYYAYGGSIQKVELPVTAVL